jgi:hypothetical protein
LLERLLERTLDCVASQAREEGLALTHAPKCDVKLLSAATMHSTEDRAVEPDGLIMDSGLPIASFEAKYRQFTATGPLREEIYQALSAARATGAALSVLVYPNAFKTRVWEVQLPGQSPSMLAAVGLDLFSYRSGGEKERGADILQLLKNPLALPAL